MNTKTSSSAEQHEQVSLLLPWYISQTLEASEQQRVEDHVRRCILCRRELVHLNMLAEAVKQASDLDVAAEASFNALRSKLQTNAQIAASAGSQTPDGGSERADQSKRSLIPALKRRDSIRTFMMANGTRLAIAASLMLAIIPVTMQYNRSMPQDGYHTLSDARPDASSEPRLRVVFSKSLSTIDIDALLAQIRARRIEGPNSVGAYTVGLEAASDDDAVATALDFLRNRRDVVLAEPVLQP